MFLLKKQMLPSLLAARICELEKISPPIFAWNGGCDLKFTVLGTPQALKRHRVARSGHMYDPSVQDKKAFSLQASVYAPKELIEKPLSIILLFYFKRPKSHFRTGK